MINFQAKIAEAERLARILDIGQYKLYERLSVSAQTWMRIKSDSNYRPNMRTWEKIEAGVAALAEEAAAALAQTAPES